MQYIDVFNGDADGLCALLQIRRSQPKQSKLVTGIKRDINLLSRVDAKSGDHITVLDISFEKNINDVIRLLDNGASIDYFDHHKTGDLIQHDNLFTDINLAADTCTSLIIDKRLNGQHRAWTLTAAFGDNLTEVAMLLGIQSGFTDNELATLKQLGILLNYNGYGATVDDLFFHPAKLFEKLLAFATPFDFLADDQETYQVLAEGYTQDMALANKSPILHETNNTVIIQLPDEAWARRVSGVFSNDLANNYPDRAHATLTNNSDGSFLVSVRAPLNRKYGANELVSQFPSGGGRKAAAGINHLPADMLEQFMAAFETQFSV
jgi:hypothetical protein